MFSWGYDLSVVLILFVRGWIMKFGVDIHGVIDANPEFFSAYTHMLIEAGHEVHIITGPRFSVVGKTLKDAGVKWTHFFSIVEHEESKGTTEIVWDKKGDPFMDFNVWDRAKGEYCAENNIDLHVDDSSKYSEYFTTPFVLYKHNKEK
jgi:hypothetical protein